MGKKKIIVVAAVLLFVAVVCTVAAVGFLLPGNDAGYSLNDDSPAENAGTIVEEQGTDQGDSYVAPDGSGAISRDDYDSDEEYEKALIDSGSAQVEIPYESVSEKQPNEKYDHGYFKYIVNLDFYYKYGEERARQIVNEVGGIWASDTFAWSASKDNGIALVTTLFMEADSRSKLEEVCDRFEQYEEIEEAVLETYFESSCANSEGVSSTSFGIDTDDQYSELQYWLAQSRFVDAWQNAHASKSVSVAVLDSGVDLDHEDLAGNIGTTLPYDAFNKTVLQGDNEDSCGHGTEVSGVVSAIANNSLGIAGGSYNATLIPVRVNKTGIRVDPDSVVRGFDYLFSLSKRPGVVNMSFSGTKAAWGVRFDDIEARIDKAVAEHDIVCVAAAGNDGTEQLSYPAAYEEVISVSSISLNGKLSDFSTWNDKVDLCAPGEGIYTTAHPGFSSSMYCYTEGTSFAAPQVSAAAALVRAAHPGYNTSEVKQALSESAVKLSSMDDSDEAKKKYGAGALDAAAAVLWSDQKGSGSGDTGGNWSPTAGGSLYDTYREQQGR